MTPSNTGSRNALITWAVTASILGFAMLIWALISYTQADKAQKDLVAMQAAYGKVVDRGGLTGGNVALLEDVRNDTSRGFQPNMKLIDLAVERNNRLTALIAGSGLTDDKQAQADAQAAIDAAHKAAAGGAIKGDSLVAALTSATQYITKLNGDIEGLKTQLADAEKARQDALAEKATLVAQTDEAVKNFTTTANTSQSEANAYRKSVDQQLADAQGQVAAKSEELIKNNQALTEKINEVTAQLTQEKQQTGDLKSQLANYRVPTDQIVNQADGQVTRIASGDRVYINLGRGDQISAGMTFEVYPRTGVPHVTSADASQDKLLKGKASIEVINVQQGISECRVVRSSPGATITEGDPIVNVVYDKRVKFNFYVFGKFNLDYKGEASERDADIVRRLISNWGASVTDKLDTKTDFVVLGEEPVVPSYTQDELAREPEKAYQKEQQEQALAKFNEVLAKANSLNIPVLNQTRFLYMVGYYEEAAR